MSEDGQKLDKVLQLAIKIDERLSGLTSRHDQLEEKFETLTVEVHGLKSEMAVSKARDKEIADLNKEVRILEKRINEMNLDIVVVKSAADSSKNKFDKMFDYAFKIGVSIASGYILFQLGVG